MRRSLGTCLAGVGLTLCALVFDSSTLFVPGVALTLLGAVSPAWLWLAATNTTVERTLAQTHVLEGEPLRCKVTVHSQGPRLPGGVVHDPLARAPLELPRRTRDVTREFEAAAGRRGRRLIAPPAVLVEDPLGLARIGVPGAGAGDELLVLPRTFRVRDGHGGTLSPHLPLGVAGRPDGVAAVDLDGLRPYREGTSASRIHWPAVARGAGLIERRLRPEGDTTPLVVLDARAAADGDDVDAAVRAAASLVLELGRSRGCALLLPGEPRPVTIYPDLAAWPAAHVRLALVQGGPDAHPPSLRGAPGRIAAVYYVSARRLVRIPSELQGVARGAAVLVMPPGGGRPSFEVAGCHGFVVGPGGEVRAA